MNCAARTEAASPSSVGARQSAADGTLRIFLAEALLLPTGLITAAFLTRRLGAESYGLFTLTATVVSWIEWSIASAFARATNKFIGEAADWRPVGATVVRLHLGVSVTLALLLRFAATPIARALGDPALSGCLGLFAWDIPVFSLAQAHRNILVGLGDYRQRALATAMRWIVRLILIILLVQWGLSVRGAILGSIGASLAELAVCRWFVRPSFVMHSQFGPRRLCDYALPLFLAAMTMRLYDKADLFLLKILGGTNSQAGLYGAAQNLAILPGLFALSFCPVLLSSISRALRTGDHAQARAIAGGSLRLVMALLPLAAVVAGTAPEIMGLLYGAHFTAAAPWLSWLIFGSVGVTVIATATTLLTALGRPGWTWILVGPLLPTVIVCHLLVIPRYGPLGAAMGTTAAAFLGAVISVAAVSRLEGIGLPTAAFGRGLVIAALILAVASHWPTPGLLLSAKLALLAGAALAALAWTGSLDDLPPGRITLLLQRGRIPFKRVVT